MSIAAWLAEVVARTAAEDPAKYAEWLAFFAKWGLTWPF